MYVEVLHHTESEFWKSSYRKICFILNQYTGANKKQSAPNVDSMSSIPWW